MRTECRFHSDRVYSPMSIWQIERILQADRIMNARRILSEDRAWHPDRGWSVAGDRVVQPDRVVTEVIGERIVCPAPVIDDRVKIGERVVCPTDRVVTTTTTERKEVTQGKFTQGGGTQGKFTQGGGTQGKFTQGGGHECQKAERAKNENIFIFLANIIGYVRIILLCVSMWFVRTDYIIAAVTYLLCFLLDPVDGFFARRFEQCTLFGELMDLLIDKVGTMAFLMNLAWCFPQYSAYLYAVIIIDVVSHWMLLHVSAILQRDYKDISERGFRLLRWYYNSKVCFTLICLLNEVFFLSAYVWYFADGPVAILVPILPMVMYATLPFVIIKAIMHLLQCLYAIVEIAKVDHLRRARTNFFQRGVCFKFKYSN